MLGAEESVVQAGERARGWAAGGLVVSFKRKDRWMGTGKGGGNL